jgi:hypothetical protein
MCEEPLGFEMTLEQAEFMRCKRKSEATNHPAKRRPTRYNNPAVEQWLTATSPAAEPNLSHKRTRSECETTRTCKRQRFNSDTISLQLTRKTLRQLEAAASVSPAPPPFMDSQTERSVSSDRTESLSAYDARFNDELERRNIYFADHQDFSQPQNIDKILEVLDRRKENTPQLELQARNYRKILDTSGNEADAMQSLVPKVLPVDAIRLSDHECTIANQQWGRHVLHRSELRPSLAAPNPTKHSASERVVSHSIVHWPSSAERPVQRRNHHHSFLLLTSLWKRKVNRAADSSQSGSRYGCSNNDIDLHENCYCCRHYRHGLLWSDQCNVCGADYRDYSVVMLLGHSRRRHQLLGKHDSLLVSERPHWRKFRKGLSRHS